LVLQKPAAVAVAGVRGMTTGENFRLTQAIVDIPVPQVFLKRERGH